jgi:DNA polymerase-3 subunit gamma/tau
MLGAIDQSYLYDLLVALHEKNGQRILDIANDMASRSVLFDAALQDLATLLHRIALAQTVPQAIVEDEPERERLLELAQLLTAEEVQLYYQIAIHGRDEIDLAPDEYAGFTMTLLRMLSFSPEKGGARQSLPVTPIEKAVAKKPAAVTSDPVIEGKPDWATLLSQLNVQSMAQQLAKNCVLENLSDDAVTLRLAHELKHSQTKMASDKLQQALSEYFAKPIKLNIVLGKVDIATPAIIEQNDKQLKQQQANDAVAQDSFVIEAQRELGASLIAESIKPIQQI